jgi:hypothetical protein
MMIYFSTKTEKWRGMLVCTEQQYHASLMRDFPGLVPHSRLGKWLFLAEAGNEEFEQVAERIISAVLRCDPRIGVYPTSKKKTQH